LKKIKNFKLSESDSIFISLIKNNSESFLKNFKKESKNTKNFESITNKFCIEKLNNYLEIMFKLSLKSKTKNTQNNSQNNISLNEEEIFGKEFFQIFEYFLMIVKLRYIKIIHPDLKNMNENMQSHILPHNSRIAFNEQQKEEMKFLKSAYSMLFNNCGFSYEICKKSFI